MCWWQICRRIHHIYMAYHLYAIWCVCVKMSFVWSPLNIGHIWMVARPYVFSCVQPNIYWLWTLCHTSRIRGFSRPYVCVREVLNGVRNSIACYNKSTHTLSLNATVCVACSYQCAWTLCHRSHTDSLLIQQTMCALSYDCIDWS